MWTPEKRSSYGRSKLRQPSDLTDEEGSIIALLSPPTKRDGNKRTIDVLAMLDRVMYILSTGCQWVALEGRPDARSDPSRSTCCVRSRPARRPLRRLGLKTI